MSDKTRKRSKGMIDTKLKYPLFLSLGGSKGIQLVRGTQEGSKVLAVFYETR